MSKKKLWFKAKHYGWGWYPSSWEGYLTMALYAIVITVNVFLIDYDSLSVGDAVLRILPLTLIATGFLIWICYKTGEKPGWRWGK